MDRDDQKRRQQTVVAIDFLVELLAAVLFAWWAAHLI
jgi:hypothetical protein